MTMSSSRSLLLGAGLAAALLFIGVTLVEIVVRPGFSIERHAISMLSLGPYGWIMVATFIVCGILTLAFALAFWRASGARIGAALLAVFGACSVLAGFFPTRAAFGFPPGVTPDRQLEMDLSAIIHFQVFMLAMAALILACLVLAVHYWRSRAGALATGLLAIGIILPVVIGMGLERSIPQGVAFYSAAVLSWEVIALVAWQELTA
jgi:hypothetical membrane protein